MKLNKRQKRIIADFIVVVTVTIALVIGITNFKDHVNRSEGKRAITHLGEIVVNYREQHGYVPPERVVEQIKDNLEGRARLGKLTYRGLYADLSGKEKELLAYTQENYRSWFIEPGFIVLWVTDIKGIGQKTTEYQVEWIAKDKFQEQLDKYETDYERSLRGK